MAGRMLRLLLINDEEVKEVGSQFIEIVRCPTGFGNSVATRLAHWHSHMYLWGTGQVPDFDLLLIDIRFDRDTYDPAYFGEPHGPQLYTPREKAVNPFGLLHALPLVARQDLTNMPFVWGSIVGIRPPRRTTQWPSGLLACSAPWSVERAGTSTTQERSPLTLRSSLARFRHSPLSKRGAVSFHATASDSSKRA